LLIHDLVVNDFYIWSGEGFAGAFYKDTVDELVNNGLTYPRLVYKTKAFVKTQELSKKLGNTQYAFLAYRTFKLPEGVQKEASRVCYHGDIPGASKEFMFDTFTTFKTGEEMVVDGELAAILKNTRFSKFFTFSPLQANDTPVTKSMEVNPFDL